MGRQIETIPTEVMETLVEYHWPGNVRELENIIERAVILSPGSELQIPTGDLKSMTAAKPTTSQSDVKDVTLADAERLHIVHALRDSNWVLGGTDGAAARLGMKRTTLQSKMKKLGITRPV